MPSYARLYRVLPWLESASEGEPGHPLYVHTPQGAGRVDNPQHYLTFYLSDRPEGAIGERFGNHRTWTSDLLSGPPFLVGSVQALATFEASGASILDLDDPKALTQRRLRPSRVVTRERAETQRWALEIHGEGRWDGVRWWSYYDPEWGSFGVWNQGCLRLLEVSPLSEQVGSVEAVALRLNRVWDY